MENNFENKDLAQNVKKELEQNAKKEWISPMMQELNLKGGTNPRDPEQASNGSYSRAF